MKKFFSLFLFCCLAASSGAQVVLENNPPSVHWFEILTPHFQLLFPEGFETQAQRTATVLEKMYLPATRSLTSKPPRISVVLQNQSSISNAFVSVTPRRAEFYSMPSQNYNFIGNNDWMDFIAVHELRHVVQYEHARQGFNKLVYYLFGNYGLSAMASVSVPSWFWEGDAVAVETAYTPTGRGEIPQFDLVFRTNFLNDRTFNYHKQMLGSYRHQIPNEYVLGYHMVSYLRKKTGDPLIWDRITSRAWKSSILPFTFTRAIKRESGLKVNDLFEEMANELSASWKESADTIALSAFTRVHERPKQAYTDFSFPQVLADGQLVAMKSGIGDIETLVALSDHGEEKLHVPGLVNNTGMLSGQGTKLVWNEFRFDPRWRVKTHSVIVSYDTETGQRKTITPFRGRFIGAALSPDGGSVVTVRSDNQYRHELVIVRTKTGNVIRKFANPDNSYYSMARFSADGSAVVALKTSARGKAVVKVRVADGAEEEIIPAGDENIGYPVLTDTHLLFNSPVSGIDNIYAVALASGKRYQVTNSRYGAYNPVLSPDGASLYYNDQTKNGLDVVRIAFDPRQWKPVGADPVNTTLRLAPTIIAQEGGEDLLRSDSVQSFPVSRYNPAKGIVNPFAWGAYLNNTLAQVDFGVTSQDVLSTTAISLGYRYDINEETGDLHAGISYQGWYPILNADIYYGSRDDDSRIGLSAGNIRDVQFNWKETGVSLGVSVPLLLTRSKYITSLSFSNDVGLTQTTDFSSRLTRNGTLIYQGEERYVPANDTLFYLYNDITDFGKLVYNHFTVDFSTTLKQSHRDFNPKWGQLLTLESFSTPFGGDYEGSQWSVRGVTFLPGLLPHHSLFFRGGYQKSPDSFELDNYAFRNRIFKPRGYSYPRNNSFYTLSGNYALPLWYPDLALGPVAYIQRIKASLFYDYGRGEGTDYYYNFESGRIYLIDRGETYTSYGAELTFDVNLFRLLPQFELGVRASHLAANSVSDGGWTFEFLIANIPF